MIVLSLFSLTQELGIFRGGEVGEGHSQTVLQISLQIEVAVAVTGTTALLIVLSPPIFTIITVDIHPTCSPSLPFVSYLS